MKKRDTLRHRIQFEREGGAFFRSILFDVDESRSKVLDCVEVPLAKFHEAAARFRATLAKIEAKRPKVDVLV